VRILVAPDKFKGSLSACEAADCIAAGLRDVLPAAIIETIPIADGGEGTAEVVRDACDGEWVTCEAHDALGRAITARYVWLHDQKRAVMDMSEAAGLGRIAPSERDPLQAHTCGVREMLLDADRRGASEIIVGLGGSATNDGGFGMARAFGFRFYGAAGHELERSDELVDLAKILPSPIEATVSAAKRAVPERPTRLPLQARIIAAADVRNPLLGTRGATRTFGPQKGAAPDQLEVLEEALARLADVVTHDLGCDFRESAGAGAAGGLGFGLMSFCGATIRPGFDLVARMLDLKAAVQRADLVITGEGKLDDQTLEGKAPAGVAHLARKLGKRVFAIVGASSEGPEVRNLFDGLYVLARKPATTQEAMRRAGELLRERARELGRAL
jgi:glycerate 2-kinase